MGDSDGDLGVPHLPRHRTLINIGGSNDKKFIIDDHKLRMDVNRVKLVGSAGLEEGVDGDVAVDQIGIDTGLQGRVDPLEDLRFPFHDIKKRHYSFRKRDGPA